MSLFRKVLGAVGIGAAKVNAELDQPTVMPGGEVTGTLTITGGKITQSINKLDLDIYCNYTVEEEVPGEGENPEENTETVIRQMSHRLSSFQVDEAFEINPGEVREIPFSMGLSPAAPLSVGDSRAWLATNLDIDKGLDKSDSDELEVVPTHLQGAFFASLEELGFQLYECDSCAVKGGWDSLPFVQEFEFKTVSGPWHGRLDELEVVFLNHGDSLEIYLELDRKSGGLLGFFREALEMDETRLYLSIDDSHLDDLTEAVAGLIDDHI